jgi:hypothetical protein
MALGTCAVIKFNNFQFKADDGYPVPLITVETSYNRLSDLGLPTTVTDTYTLEGKIFQPPTSGLNSYSGLLQKAGNLKNIFNKKDGLFVVGSGYSGIAQVRSFQIKPTSDYWTQTIDYSIALAVESSGSGSGYPVESYSNSWQLQPVEEYNFFYTGALSGGFNLPPLRITHTVSAVGKYIPDATGSDYYPTMEYVSKIKLAHAVKCVKENFNKNCPISTGGNVFYDFIRGIEVNPLEGSYSVTDTFLYFPSGAFPPNNYIDTCTIESNLDESSTRTVTVQGTVKGLALPTGAHTKIPDFDLPYSLSGTGTTIYSGSMLDTARSKFYNAVNGFNTIKDSLYARATGFAGYIPSGNCKFFYPLANNQSQQNNNLATPYINPRPLSTSIGYDPMQGQVTYSFTYNNRPANLLDCSISESLSISDTLPSQQIAEIFVIGRRLGPVLQNMGTFSSPTRQVTFDVTLPKASAISGMLFPTKIYSAITGIVELFNPKHANPLNKTVVQSYVREDSENWDPTSGRFTKTKTWIYTKCQGTLEDLTNPNLK